MAENVEPTDAISPTEIVSSETETTPLESSDKGSAKEGEQLTNTPSLTIVQEPLPDPSEEDGTIRADSTEDSEKKKKKKDATVINVDNYYQIKPNLEEKFKEIPVKEIIRNVVTSSLTGKIYDPNNVKKWTIGIANEVNEKVKELRMKRYKHIVQVILGEMKGAGVKTGVRCVWDSDTDSYTSEIFMNDTIFCVTTVFAVFLY